MIPAMWNLADIPDEQKRQPYEDAYFLVRSGWERRGIHMESIQPI